MPLSDPQALVDRLAHKRRKYITLLLVANATLAISLVLLVYLISHATKASYESQAESVAEGLAGVVQAGIASELNRADAVIRATADEIRRLRQHGEAQDAVIDGILAERIKLLKDVEAFRLSDASGSVRWGNGVVPGPQMDVSEREYFRTAKTHAADETIVAGPLRSRVSGNWVLVFVRPMFTRVGDFDGILYVSVSTRHIQDLFSGYDLGLKDAVTLRTRDLRLVARHSPGATAPVPVGDATVSSELRQAQAKSASVGSFVSEVPIDGERRTTAYRAVAGWPFTVYAGIHHERFFAGWKRQAWTFASIAAFSYAVVSAAMLLLYRSSTREARAMQALADQTTRIETLLRIAGDGIHIVDRTGRLIETSDSFARMLNSTREQLLGRHVSTWDVNQDASKIAAWLAKTQDGDSQRVEVQHRREDGAVIDVELQWGAVDIRGELYVFAAGRDVTAIKRLLKEQTAMLESDLVGMARIEHREIQWRNAAFERIFGYELGELAGRPVRQLYSDDETYEDVGRKVDATLLAGRAYRDQLRLVRKTGEAVWVDFGAVRLTEDQIFATVIDVTAIKEANERLKHAAFHDPLTHLPNRLLLIDRLTQALETSRRDGFMVALCYMDLDGFKAVNDAFGHECGDKLLVEVARRISNHIRPCDTAARMGGDEFVLLLTVLSDEAWRSIVERVSFAVKMPFALSMEVSVHVGATFGVAVSKPGDDCDSLLDRADLLMLQGKRSGKGGVYV